MGKGLIGREFVSKDNGKELKILPNKPCFIDFNENQHMFICAPTGQGKTYTVGVYLEALIKNMNGNAVLIFDINSDYWGLKKSNPDKYLIAEWNNQVGNEVVAKGFDNVEIWIPKGDESKFESDEYDRTFSLKMTDFHNDSLCFVFGLDPYEQMTDLFVDIEHRIMKELPDYTIDDFIEKIISDGLELNYKQATVDGLTSRIRNLRTLGIITNDGVEINDIIQPNIVIILELSRSNNITQNSIMHFIIGQTLSRRYRITPKVRKAEIGGYLIDRPPGYIPPVDFVLEECYIFKDPIINILNKQARKYGIRLTTISQDLEGINQSVLKNSMWKLIGAVSGSDLMSVLATTHLERTPKEAREKVKALGEGCWWFIDKTKKIDQIIRIRPRETYHPASSKRGNENLVFKDTYQTSNPDIEEPVNLLPEPITEKVEIKKESIPEKKKSPKEDNTVRFSKDYSKRNNNTFAAIRLVDKYQAGSIYLAIFPSKKGNVKCTYTHSKRLSEITDEFLLKDTDTTTRKDAIAALKQYYPELTNDSLCFISVFCWVQFLPTDDKNRILQEA